MLLIKYLYVKTFFSIPHNQFCQVREAQKATAEIEKVPHTGLTHRARAGTPQPSSVFQVLLDFLLCSSLFLPAALIPLPPASLCVPIWTLYGAEMWVSVFAQIKEEQQPVTHSLLCQKQNSTDKGNRNTLCPSRRWVPSLRKAELSLKWQNLSFSPVFIFQRPSAMTCAA